MQAKNENENKIEISGKKLLDLLDKILKKNNLRNLNGGDSEEKNITKDYIEKGIFGFTIAESETEGGSEENNDFYKSTQATNSRIDTHIQNNKRFKSGQEWQSLYYPIVFETYSQATCTIIEEIDKEGKIIKYCKKQGNKTTDKKTIDLSKTGFSKTISIILAKNALMWKGVYDNTTKTTTTFKQKIVEKKDEKTITDEKYEEEVIKNEEIYDIAKLGANKLNEEGNAIDKKDSKELDDYKQKLIETFLLELRKYPETDNAETIQDVLAIVCKEISGEEKEKFVINLDDDKESLKEGYYYYFYKEKLSELDEAGKKLNELFGERSKFINDEEDKDPNFNYETNKKLIKSKIGEINNIINDFNKGGKIYFKSENKAYYNDFMDRCKEIKKDIDDNEQYKEKKDEFEELSVGFLSGEKVIVEEKPVTFSDIEGIEDFKSKAQYCVLAAFVYIDDNNLQQYKENNNDDKDLENLLEIVAKKDESSGKWYQYNDIEQNYITNKIKQWELNGKDRSGKPVFAALTYYDNDKPIVNFISRGHLRPAYSYIRYQKEVYNIFMIPEIIEKEKVEPKYYVFNESGEKLEKGKIPFEIKHNIVNCSKAIGCDDKDNIENIDFSSNHFNDDIDKVEVKHMGVNSDLKEALESNYFKNRSDYSKEELREAVKKNPLYREEVKTNDGKKIKADALYKKVDSSNNDYQKGLDFKGSVGKLMKKRTEEKENESKGNSL